MINPDRKLYIIGDIDSENYAKFAEELTNLEASSEDPIEIELNSSGGTATDGLAYASRIQNSECHITVTGYGLVASAAIIILSAGYHRQLDKDAWAMVHEDECEFNGRVTELEKYAKHMRRMEDQWNALLEKYTDTKKEVWEQLHKKETYLTAQECKDLGLIDEIV